MTSQTHDPDTTNILTPELESNLRALSTWPETEKTELWKSALSDAAAQQSNSHRNRGTYLRWALSALSAAAILALAVGVFMPALGKARNPARSVGRIGFDAGSASPAELYDQVTRQARSRDIAGAVESIKKPGSGYSIPEVDGEGGKSDLRMRGEGGSTHVPADDSKALSDSRSVIRRSTLELAVADAREAFAKCQHLIRPELGEFIEGSTLTGQDKDTRAELTLRVAAVGGRLDEVLNQLRTLGKVDTEQSTGDDVSAQVVDLDARLRNEKQVETEILKLLESRKEAKLADIIELRDKLSSIRQVIEQLQGRRDTLGRQISLASILVIIRPDSAPKAEPKPSSMFDSFTRETSAAWAGGVEALTATIAFLIRIAVGGLIWWLLLVAAIAIARRLIRRINPDPAAIPVSA